MSHCSKHFFEIILIEYSSIYSFICENYYNIKNLNIKIITFDRCSGSGVHAQAIKSFHGLNYELEIRLR